jgi:hypothetical protein
MNTFCQSITAQKMAIGYETSDLLNLTTYQKGTYYFGIKVLINFLPI